MKKWTVGKPDMNTVKKLMTGCGVTGLAACVLAQRGYTSPELVAEKLDSGELSDPFLLRDMQEAADAVNNAIDCGESICVYGDYDCDGIMSTVILYTYLLEAGAQVSYYIPERSEGYGLNRDAIKRIADELAQIAEEYGILDLGHHAVTMYMYKGDRHVATREFEMGLSSLDDIVADKFGVEKHLAHTYVLNNFENCLEAEECTTFYDNISVELMRAINFYEFSNQGSSMTDIWVCGGGAVNLPLIRSIDETLEANLHPLYKLLPGEENVPQNNAFAQAIGITLEI